MSVKIDNDKIFRLVKQLTEELNNREQMALIDGLVHVLNFNHNNRNIKHMLNIYLKHRGIYNLWLREAIDKSIKDTSLK